MWKICYISTHGTGAQDFAGITTDQQDKYYTVQCTVHCFVILFTSTADLDLFFTVSDFSKRSDPGSNPN